MENFLVKIIVYVVAVAVVLLISRLVMGNTKKTMNSSVDLQEEALRGQQNAIEMTHEMLEIQKQTLSEIKRLNKNLEKR